jgi:class 3 adenylate cyclase
MRLKAPTRGRLLDAKAFFRLLRRRTPRTAARIDRAIEARALRTMAVLVSDASGFSRRTHREGILQFLSVMTRCYDRLLPMIRRHRGACVSHGADNIVAVFNDPADAVRAAAAMQRAMRARNRGRASREQFHVCIGIHWGPLLRLRDDIFGPTVNVAAKVGEDLAGKDEILVTGEVAEAVRERVRCVYDRSVTLGGRAFELYRVRG